MATVKVVKPDAPVSVVLTMSEHEAGILYRLLRDIPVLGSDLDSIYTALNESKTFSDEYFGRAVAGSLTFTDDYKRLIHY